MHVLIRLDSELLIIIPVALMVKLCQNKTLQYTFNATKGSAQFKGDAWSTVLLRASFDLGAGHVQPKIAIPGP